MGTSLILGFMLLVGYIKLSEADSFKQEVVAGETEDSALLYASERKRGPAFAMPPEEP